VQVVVQVGGEDIGLGDGSLFGAFADHGEQLPVQVDPGHRQGAQLVGPEAGPAQGGEHGGFEPGPQPCT